MVAELEHLNVLTKALANLDESLMNVCWNGKPREGYVAQLVEDAGIVSDLLRADRDALARSIGAAWDSASERYVSPEP